MTKKTTKETIKKVEVAIKPPNLRTIDFKIEGLAPYVQNKFSQKALQSIKDTQEAGSKSSSKKKREPKDFKAAYKAAMHISHKGWVGIPAPAFRCAMIDACRLVGFVMTRAKLAVFIHADGFDAEDGTPLVKITGKPKYTELGVRLEKGGMDIRARPMWENWGALVRVQYDADQFSEQDMANLFARAGLQVGIGEGRPSSKKSAGMGWGIFKIVN